MTHWVILSKILPILPILHFINTHRSSFWFGEMPTLQWKWHDYFGMFQIGEYNEAFYRRHLVVKVWALLVFPLLMLLWSIVHHKRVCCGLYQQCACRFAPHRLVPLSWMILVVWLFCTMTLNCNSILNLPFLHSFEM